MSEDLGTATLVLETDDSRARRGLSNFEQQAKQSGGRSARFFGAALKTGLVAAGAVAVGAVVGIKKSIDAASDLGESINAVNVTFGKASDKVLKFGEDSATTVGLSQRAFNQLATPLGAMLQNYGFAADEAADKTIDLTTRAADMASVFNTDVDEAMTAIQAALRGESDPIEKFGVGLNEASIQAYAVKEGISAAGEEMTANQKTVARLGLLFEQTDKFAGDFHNTSGSLANQQKILGARFENLQAKIGQKLLPVAVRLAEWANRFIAWIEVNWPRFEKAIRDSIDRVRPLFTRLVEWWNGTLLPAIRNVVAKARQFWNRFGADIMRNLRAAWTIFKLMTSNILKTVEVFLAILRGDWSAAWRGIKSIVSNTLRAIWTAIRTMARNFFNAAKGLGNAIKDGIMAGLRGLAGLVSSAARAAINALINVINGLTSFTINVPDILPGPDSYTVDFPDIPNVHRGGVVMETGLAVVHRGEEWSGVGPWRKDLGGGAPVFNFPRYSGSKRELMADIKAGLDEYRRKFGRDAF